MIVKSFFNIGAWKLKYVEVGSMPQKGEKITTSLENYAPGEAGEGGNSTVAKQAKNYVRWFVVARIIYKEGDHTQKFYEEFQNKGSF